MSHSSPAQASGLKSEPDGKTGQKLTPGKAKRKTKRLVWTDELHLRFVSAVFELGVKNASPKSLLALMGTKSPTEGLTAEHIKSHLQKYRINYKRSRLEVQRLNEKRSFKRHRRAAQSSESKISSGHPVELAAEDPWPSSASANQQWDADDALLLEDDTPEQHMHMHMTMQQRMDFHRELLLTHSVEVASGLSWASRMNSVDSSSGASRVASGSCIERQSTEDASFLQAWANAEQLRQQEDQVYGRLHEQQQSLFSPQTQDAAAVAPLAVATPQPELPPRAAVESKEANDGMDLSSWGRLSLTIDPDDDVFGFLGA